MKKEKSKLLIYFKIGKVFSLILGLFIGVTVLTFGISTYKKNINELKNGVTVEATITKIIKQKTYNPGYDKHPRYTYDIYVKYEYDGIEYNDKWINLSTNLLKVGDKIHIKIDKDKPDVPIYIEQSKIAIIIIIIGIFLIIFQIFLNIFILN